MSHPVVISRSASSSAKGDHHLGGVHVGEAGGPAGGDVAAEDPDQPYGHDPSLDRVLRAELAFPALGALEHPRLGQGVDSRFVEAARTHIGEPVLSPGRRGSQKRRHQHHGYQDGRPTPPGPNRCDRAKGGGRRTRPLMAARRGNGPHSNSSKRFSTRVLS